MILESLYWTLSLAWRARQQARIPFLPQEELIRRQRKHLREAITYAYRHVPFYRDEMASRGLTPEDIRTVEDLERLPIVEREMIRESPERFRSEIIPQERMLYTHSSGSTGIPIEVWHNREAVMANATHGERQRSIYVRFIGKSLGYRETVVISSAGVALHTQSMVASHLALPSPMRIKRQYLEMHVPFEQAFHAMQTFQPDILYSYGSYFNEFFPYLYAKGLTLPSLKLVTFSSDALWESTRQLIENAFGLPALGIYEAIEAFQIGFECEEKRGYHLNIDLYPIRVVDKAGHTLPPGETGEVILSNLVNRGTVLLNYRLRDLVTLSPEPCPCGRNLPLLARIEGRSDEFVPLASGQKVPPESVRTLFIVHPEICQFQILLRKDFACDVRLVVRPGTDQEALARALRTAWRERFGEALRLREILFVSTIPKPPGGKPRIIIPYQAEDEAPPQEEHPTLGEDPS